MSIEVLIISLYFLRRLNPLSISAWQVKNEISLHLSVEGKVLLLSLEYKSALLLVFLVNIINIVCRCEYY